MFALPVDGEGEPSPGGGRSSAPGGPRNLARKWGGEAEEQVARWLRRRGHRVLARNVRLASGEIDIVSQQGEDLYFVEVRARGEGAWADGAESVDPIKRGRIVAAAQAWLMRAPSYRCCYLAVASVSRRWWGPRITWIPQAFDAKEP